MNATRTVLLALAAVGIAAGATISSAQAACVQSIWSKTSGDSFANSIRGRDCNGNLSVRFYGSTGKTGWLAMQRIGTNKLRATFVDAHITTRVRMKTSGTKMWVNFKHEETIGSKSATSGSYKLISMQ